MKQKWSADIGSPVFFFRYQIPFYIFGGEGGGLKGTLWSFYCAIRNAWRYRANFVVTFPKLSLRIFCQVLVRSCHCRAGQMTLPPQNCHFTLAKIFKWSIWNFHVLIRASVPTRSISQNFGFGDLGSVQCCDLTIIRQWQNVEMPFIPKLRVGACHLSPDIPILSHSRYAVGIDTSTSCSGRSGSYEVRFVCFLLHLIEQR